MHPPTKPGKEAIRDWLRERWRERLPPPPVEQIQAALGWRVPDTPPSTNSRVCVQKSK